MLRTLNKGNLTQVATISVAACISLGLAYGLLTAPICWRCWSYGTHTKPFSRRIGEIMVTDSKGVRTRARWFCGHCTRAWKPEVPWIDDPPDFGDTPRKAWPWKGQTDVLIFVENGRFTRD